MLLAAAMLVVLAPFASCETGVIEAVNASLACGPHQPLVVKEKLGFILSPKFDNFHYYPPNSRCSWILEAPQGKAISIKTMYFGLGLDCSEDALEIYDGRPPGGKRLGKFCGYFMPPSFVSRSNTMFLKFYTGKVPRNTGFQMYFEQTYPIATCTEEQISCRHSKACVDPEKACDGTDDCGDGTDEENCDATDRIVSCGRPKIPPVLGSDRIVGGRDAVPGSWPWQVSLRQVDLAPFSHMCGGVLISSKWVVTAGHCFKKKMDTNLWHVMLGKYYKLVPESQEQLRYIKSIYVHPGYKGNEANWSTPWLIRKQHDIALVELNAPVAPSDVVSPVCVPSNSTRLSPGDECYVTGWGETYRTGFELVLKQAAVPILSTATCRKMHFLWPIAETMLCAGYAAGGHDSCQGDSGGPLVYRRGDGSWNLAGVVSTGGSICAEKNQPGIYTYMPYYVDWIANVTKLQFPAFM